VSKLLLLAENRTECHAVLGPWMALSMSGLPFRETVFEQDRITLDPLTPTDLHRHEQPVLYHGRQAVWGAVGIMEYLAELFPEKNLWPKTISARIFARAVSHEAQSNLAKLSGNGAASSPGVARFDGENDFTESDKVRIEQIIRECRSRFGKGGRFLFGRFSIPDAMLAPFILFFEAKSTEVEIETRSYMHALLATEAMCSWREAFSARPPKTMTPNHARSYISDVS
jgi:glutathione S-transferase